MAQAASKELNPVIIEHIPLYRVQALEVYPALVHAIFTRRGGVSRPPFHSLNLGQSVGDQPQAVERNFRQICQVLGIRPAETVSCHLVHSTSILTIERTNRQPVMGRADGLVTAEPGIYLAMRFGDCTPLIFYDPVRRAVGLTHAGWRGTMQNAAGASVKAMQTRLDCRPENIIAVIGPAIGPCCYEVGPDVIAAAQAAFVEPNSLFVRRNGKADRANFDMWEANRRQLAAAGVGQIIQTGLCTACRTDEFFSHRAEQGRTGRFGVVIGLREQRLD